MIAFYKDEEILKTTRRHSLALWIEIICLSIASVAPYVFARLNILFFSSVKTLLTIKMTLVFVGFYCLWLVVVIVFFAIAISDHYLDIWILTNRRIINISQKGIFSREIKSVDRNQIIQITMKPQTGIEKRFNYGTLIISKSDGEQVLIEEVPNPEKLKHYL